MVVGRSVWLCGWLVGWLIDCLVGRLIGQPTGRLVGWLVGIFSVVGNMTSTSSCGHFKTRPSDVTHCSLVRVLLKRSCYFLPVFFFFSLQRFSDCSECQGVGCSQPTMLVTFVGTPVPFPPSMQC